MKNRGLLVVKVGAILFLLSMVGCKGAAAADTQAPGSQPLNINVSGQQAGLWVSGQGKVKVTPDIATLTLGVSSQSPTVADAQFQAATAMDKVMSALTGSGVASKDIQTRNFSVQQLTRYDNARQQSVITGYQVSNMVTAKIRAIDKIGLTIDAVAAAGGDSTRINGVNFSVDQPENFFVQARELAMNDAKAKADQLARLGSLNLGKPTYVSENSSSPPMPFPVSVARSEMAGAAAPTTPISPGEMDITINVQVTYAIQ